MKKSKKQKNKTASAISVETACTRNPFGLLNNYTPLSPPENRVYQALREGIPIIDAAIQKTIHLVGGFEIKVDDKNIQNTLNDFLRNINVNSNQQGIEAFINEYMNSLLTYGTAVGEIVMNSNCDIVALYNAPLDYLEIKRGKSPLDIQFYSRKELGNAVPIKRPQRILFSVLNPEAGQITGNSILKGLPFVSSILLKIFNTTGINFDRLGNIRFAVTYKPTDNPIDKNYTSERAKSIATEWSNAMNSSGSVKDFVCVGDVDIKVIGSDNQLIDTEVPVRQMLEQIVSKLGIPPFMLGLSWSSTERMSSQQADLLTSELEAYRRILTPVIEKIATAFLRTNGYACKPTVEWNNITLQDEVELAKARLYNAQAEEIEKGGDNK